MLQCLADSIRPNLITLEESMKLLSDLSIPISYGSRGIYKMLTYNSVYSGRNNCNTPSQLSHLLRFFFACFKPTWLALGSPKTNFVFTPKSIFHIFSDLIDRQNRLSHLYFVKFWTSFFLIVLIKIYPKCHKICFIAYHTTPVI